ncbi:MAG: hypothetical protein IH623_13550 [Verrucomicrobia bacterium]|nr:hypothetical protein [Verrucomicrobiota bacterium]
MSKERLEALEKDVNAELIKMAESEGSKHHPITDGVVDIDRYLSSSPKILWILKEPWEPLREDEGGGGWSVTKELIPDLIAKRQIGGIPTYRKMAYVTFSLLNNFVSYSDIPYANKDSRVGEALRSIAYINVNKFPGKTTSNPADIEFYYRRNRDILKKQIAVINPDVVIAGNILHLFYEDLGLNSKEMESGGSVDFYRQDGRLYVNAYHPGYWRCKEQKYVDDLVAVIKKNCQKSKLTQSEKPN